MPGTRKLGRATASRTAMLRAMVTFLLENGKIETTVTRAKEVKAMTEKIITKAKQNDLHSKRRTDLVCLIKHFKHHRIYRYNRSRAEGIFFPLRITGNPNLWLDPSFPLT